MRVSAPIPDTQLFSRGRGQKDFKQLFLPEKAAITQPERLHMERKPRVSPYLWMRNPGFLYNAHECFFVVVLKKVLLDL